MVVLITCKKEEYPNKTEETRVAIILKFNFSDAQRAVNPVVIFVGSLILTFMHVLFTSKNEKDSMKSYYSSVPLLVYFSKHSRAANSVVGDRSDLTEIRLGLRFYACPRYLQV